MQKSLRSLLSVDVADFTGLMSSNVKYYVGKLSADSSVHEAFRKLGHVPLEDETKKALKIYMTACQPGTTIEILLG